MENNTVCPNSQNMKSNENVQDTIDVSALSGWTKDEKFDLLQALKRSGSYDIDSIQMVISNKTHDQIKDAIEYYKKKASLHPTVVEHNIRERSAIGGTRVPLNNWAKLLMDSISFEELRTEIPDALRLIAELDKTIPGPLCTENIDFKKIYHIIANAVEGKPLPENKTAAMLLDKCIMETALSTKGFIRLSSLKFVLDNMSTQERQLEVIPRHVTNQEEQTVLSLTSQRNYNPLNIPDGYLRSTKR